MDKRALQNLARLHAEGHLEQGDLDEVQAAIQEAERASVMFKRLGGEDSHRNWLDAEMYAWHTLTTAVCLGTTRAELAEFRRQAG